MGGMRVQLSMHCWVDCSEMELGIVNWKEAAIDAVDQLCSFLKCWHTAVLGR